MYEWQLLWLPLDRVYKAGKLPRLAAGGDELCEVVSRIEQSDGHRKLNKLLCAVQPIKKEEKEIRDTSL